MSASFDFFDFLSMLDLGLTPYPNYAIMGNWSGNYDSWFTKLAEQDTEEGFVFNAQQLVLCHFGDTDADLGMRLDKELQSWCYLHFKPFRRVSVAEVRMRRMRLDIYGGCKGAGESYNNYEPCPLHYWGYQNIKDYREWKSLYEHWTSYDKSKPDQKRMDALSQVRSFLSDAKDKGSTAWKYRCVAAAKRLRCPVALVVSDLRKEF